MVPSDGAGIERVQQQLPQVATVYLRAGIVVGSAFTCRMWSAFRIEHLECLGFAARSFPKRFGEACCIHRALPGIFA